MKVSKQFLVVILIAISNLAFSQATTIITSPNNEFLLAKECFQKGQYSLAYPFFKKIYNTSEQPSTYHTLIAQEVLYYTIVCGLQLNDKTILKKAINFCITDQNIPRIQIVNYQLGEYYFRNNQLADALEFYAKSGINNLSNAEIASMKFHQAYAYFALNNFEKAKPLFNSIRQINTNPNYIAANYYFGFISFYEKKYNEALTSFLIAENDNDYKNVVPFYIAEIYYFKGDKDKALTYSEAQLKHGEQFYNVQFQQLIGHLWFEKKDYAKAIPYLERYLEKSEKVRREDQYELSFSYYASGKYAKCIDGFKQLGGKEDSLGQNSMYLLADAYLKTNDKINARTAFLFCASNSSNAIQKEISTFSYAKLSYELGYTAIALAAIKDFFKEYPFSTYTNEAKEIEVSLLSITSNFKDALVLFDSLKVQSEQIKKVYPRILYGRAVEFINDQQIDKASLLLEKCLKASYNAKEIPLANFWLGEIAYRNGNIDQAIQYLNNYFGNPQNYGEVSMNNARYNLGYCLLKKEQYKAAIPYFEAIAKTINPNASKLEQDAFIRAADCYFMLKQYKQALKSYDLVYGFNGYNADYALYQKAIVAGAFNNTADKLTQLKLIITQFPHSHLLADANMEIANTYLSDEKYTEAISFLQTLLNDNTAKVLWPQVNLKLGVALANLKNNKAALGYFKELVLKYPNAPESEESIEYIRNIFIEEQRPGDFINFMKDNGKPISYTEADSLTYRAAMLRYENKDFVNAAKGFDDYLASYPDGRYAIEANYFSAEINISTKNYTSALPFYKAVAAKAPNKFAERSALQAARIYYFDLKDYSNASTYFLLVKSLTILQETKLEAMRGLLRCQFKTAQWKSALTNAQDILTEKGSGNDDKIMANMIVAKNEQLDSLFDKAISSYNQVLSLGKSEISAEAAYSIAAIQFNQAKYSEAEKAAFETIKQFGSYELWVTKSYLLLGDIYFKQKDLFNAEATYKSIAANSTIQALKDEASTKLNAVNEEKNKTNKVEQPQ